MKKAEDEVMQDQDLEYYAAILNAWFTTNLEYDKSIFVLSAGGAGVLVTLLTTRGVESYLALWLYALGLFGFLTDLIVLLVIFRRNGGHLLDGIQTTTYSAG